MMIETPFAVQFAGEAPRYAPGGHGFVTGVELGKYPSLDIPEINSGFVPIWWYRDHPLAELTATEHGVLPAPAAGVRAEDMEGRALPLWYKADTGAGKFRVTVTLYGEQDCDEALVFVSRRRLAWRGALKAGEVRQVSALCDVSPIVAIGGGDAALGDLGRMEDVSVDVSVVGAAVSAVEIAPWAGTSLYLMGDSTVTDQIADMPYAPGCTYAGWGQMLSLYTGERYCVSNHAHSGLSTETFRERGHYDVLYPLLRPGDLVLIQFAHNDQKRIHLGAETGFRENLLRYIREIRQAGARPVLVTPLARNTWASARDYNDMLLPYAEAMKKIGQAENVPVLDLHGAMKASILRVGLEAAKPWYHPCDYTHLNDFGAHMAASFVAAEMVRAGLLEGCSVPAWPIHEPLTPPSPPADRTPPEGSAPLVDYGLIPDAPWPIQ